MMSRMMEFHLATLHCTCWIYSVSSLVAGGIAERLSRGGWDGSLNAPL